MHSWYFQLIWWNNALLEKGEGFPQNNITSLITSHGKATTQKDSGWRTALQNSKMGEFRRTAVLQFMYCLGKCKWGRYTFKCELIFSLDMYWHLKSPVPYLHQLPSNRGFPSDSVSNTTQGYMSTLPHIYDPSITCTWSGIEIKFTQIFLFPSPTFLFLKLN